MRDAVQASRALRMCGMCVGIFFLIYLDVLVFRLPIFSWAICPILMVIYIITLLLKRIGIQAAFRKLIFGPVIMLWMASIFTPIIASAHDHWILRTVSKWGEQLRKQKAVNGVFPPSSWSSIHGYKMRFINNGSDAVPTIYFDKFDQIRQSYSVPDDKFLEETDAF